MPTITFTEAAKIARVAPSTISRAVKSGKLSSVTLGNGQVGIDPTELERAFPSNAPRSTKQQRVQSENHRIVDDASMNNAADTAAMHAIGAACAPSHTQVQVLSDQCADLRKRLDHSQAMLEKAHDDVRRLTSMVEDMGKRAIIMLEDKTEKKKKKKKKKKGKK